MLADHRPLVGVCGGNGAAGADGGVVVLDGTAQAVEGLDPCLVQLPKEVVGKAEIVVGGVGGVGVEQGENIGHIHEHTTAHDPARVMEAGVGNGGLGEVAEGVTVRPEHGGVVDGVHGLDGRYGRRKINFHGILLSVKQS